MTPEQTAAVDELSTKALSDVHASSALQWAYRAWAARWLEKSTGLVRYITEAIDYEHEAVEHAALAEHISGREGWLAMVRSIIYASVDEERD